ncbi:MAG TPA: YqgE/AlgH family protein [Acidimicrobiales bacterium]|nr:YqgE/AlgH family protein [Acidimicrobiales bacterium]
MADARVNGALLVATPRLKDPNFDRTVVMLLDHNDQGAIGVVLNRPSELAASEALPDWSSHIAEPAVVFVGGPVAPGSAICLAEAPRGPAGEGWQPLFDGLGTVDVSRSPADLAVEIAALRVFAGYAGWAGGQLEAEIEAGAWVVVPGGRDDAMSADPATLWGDVLRRQGGVVSAMAAFPEDLSLN